MLIHFVAPTPKYQQNIGTYETIFDAINTGGHTFTRDFGNEMATQIEMGLSMLDQDDWETLFRREIASLQSADAVIADATNKSTFSVGYQTAIALALNKPVLLLLRDGSLGGSFISGLTHPKLTRRSFDDANIAQVIQEFCEGAEP